MVPDDGNRLALMLCSVCPAADWCALGDLNPHGIIRAGVAYDDDGSVLSLCSCGRPAPQGRADCFTCVPFHGTPMPVARLRGPAEPHAATIWELMEEGWSYRAIAVRIGSSAEAVRGVARRRGWRSKICGRPQASSTGVGG